MEVNLSYARMRAFIEGLDRGLSPLSILDACDAENDFQSGLTHSEKASLLTQPIRDSLARDEGRGINERDALGYHLLHRLMSLDLFSLCVFIVNMYHEQLGVEGVNAARGGRTVFATAIKIAGADNNQTAAQLAMRLWQYGADANVRNGDGFPTVLFITSTFSELLYGLPGGPEATAEARDRHWPWYFEGGNIFLKEEERLPRSAVQSVSGSNAPQAPPVPRVTQVHATHIGVMDEDTDKQNSSMWTTSIVLGGVAGLLALGLFRLR